MVVENDNETMCCVKILQQCSAMSESYLLHTDREKKASLHNEDREGAPYAHKNLGAKKGSSYSQAAEELETRQKNLYASYFRRDPSSSKIKEAF